MDFNQLVVYAGGVPPLNESKQKTWNLIGQGKSVMDVKLQGHVMALQAIIAGYETKDQPALDKAIKDYKATVALMEGDRKQFTAFLDAAKVQCMKPETEWKPENNPTFQAMVARELKFRTDAASTTAAANARITETAAFKTHMVNEFMGMAWDYRDKLRLLVHQAYTACLTQKIPPDNVTPAVNACVAAMRVTKPRDLVKFERKLLPDAEAKTIFDAIKKPDYQSIFNEYIKELNDKFALYANDLANADQAVVSQEQDFQTTMDTSKILDTAEQAANTLYIQATTEIVSTAPGMKPITETTKIKIQDDSDEWAAKVMAAYLANFQVCITKMRGKKRGKWDIEQMAGALDKAGVLVEGIEYETIKK